MPEVTHLGGRARSGSAHANSLSSEDVPTSGARPPGRERHSATALEALQGVEGTATTSGPFGDRGHLLRRESAGQLLALWAEGGARDLARWVTFDMALPSQFLKSSPNPPCPLGWVAGGWAAGQDTTSQMQPRLTTQQTTEPLPITASPLQ